MRENIEYLIEQYEQSCSMIEEDLKEDGYGKALLSVKLAAYKEIIENLQEILEESEDEEDDEG